MEGDRGAGPSPLGIYYTASQHRMGFHLKVLSHKAERILKITDQANKDQTTLKMSRASNELFKGPLFIIRNAFLWRLKGGLI